MKKSLVTRIVIIGVFFLIIVGCLVGYGWRIEWDTYSGKQRTVQTAFGLPLIVGRSSSTVLSEWRDADFTVENWVEVASGPNYGALVNYCYPKVFNHLKQMDWMIKDPKQRRAYASWILSDLEENEKVCDLSRYFEFVEDAIIYADIDFVEEFLTEEQLREIWINAKQQ